MTRESDYVQWAKDAETDGEHARAAEFWRRAVAEAIPGPQSDIYRTNALTCDGLAHKPGKHRTGRRTIRASTTDGEIFMEFSPPSLVTFREKGRRKRYPSTVAALFAFAQRCEARRIQDERVKARKLRQLNRGK